MNLHLTALTLILVAACGGDPSSETTSPEETPDFGASPTPEAAPEETPAPTEEACDLPTPDDYLDFTVVFAQKEFQLSLAPCDDLPPMTIRELLEPADECAADWSYTGLLRLVCGDGATYERAVYIDTLNCPPLSNLAFYRTFGDVEECYSDYAVALRR